MQLQEDTRLVHGLITFQYYLLEILVMPVYDSTGARVTKDIRFIDSFYAVEENVMRIPCGIVWI